MIQIRCLGLLAVTVAASTIGAAELAVLRPETWDEYAPRGKEVDCTYGDFVLRNDKLELAIGDYRRRILENRAP